MKLKYQWFLGGRVMFYVSIILMVFLICSFTVAYIVDPITISSTITTEPDTGVIEEISREYIKSLEIVIDKPIVYRFVKYKYNESDTVDDILLGTFHEWNGAYYIDICSDLLLFKDMLNDTIKHETRHLIVEYLRDEQIIDLTEYTEEIAYEKNIHYNNLFNSGVYLLKQEQKNGQ